MATLYQRLLGDKFDLLPASLRNFHSQPRGGKAAGTFKVERPFSKTLSRIADQFNLPKEADSVPVTLRVVPDGDREKWIRNIGDLLLETTQWLEGDELVEEVGMSKLRFNVEASTSGMEFIQTGRAGLPLPRAIVPTVRALVKGGEHSWYVDVTVSFNKGLLVHYEGEITPS